MENSLHKQASDAFKQMIQVRIEVEVNDKIFRTKEDMDGFYKVYDLFKADHLYVATGSDDELRKVVARRMTDRAEYYKSALRDKFEPFGATVRSLV